MPVNDRIVVGVIQGNIDTYKHWPKQMRLVQYQLAKDSFYYYTQEYKKVRRFCCILTLFASNFERTLTTTIIMLIY